MRQTAKKKAAGQHKNLQALCIFAQSKDNNNDYRVS